jgi:hypothetical protein
MNCLAASLCLLCAVSLALPAIAAEPKATDRKLRHVVAFKFKDGTAPAKIDEVVIGFSALRKKIPFIADYEAGVNNSTEGRNKGCTHCFVLTFRSEKDRDAYLVHPAHQDFVKLVLAVVDDVFVIDYWAQ